MTIRSRDISEIFDECWFKNKDSDQYGKFLSIDDSMGSSFDVEKFADMIIKECITVCNSNMGHSESYNSGRMDCVSDIKNHFGVTKE